jgi:hypothetical protein
MLDRLPGCDRSGMPTTPLPEIPVRSADELSLHAAAAGVITELVAPPLWTWRRPPG